MPQRPRRPRGEGTVYRKPDGRWAGQLSVTHPDGRRVRPVVHGKTRAEAVRKLRELRAEIERGRQPADHRTRLEAFLTSWLDGRHDLAPRTLHRYRELVTYHVVPHLGGRPLAGLTPVALASWHAALLGRGLSPGTVRQAHAVLRRALEDAARWGLVERNVARLVRPPRADRPLERPLTPEEARRLLDAAASTRYGSLWAVALGTGLRLGELRGLRWGDVDLERGRVRVSGQLTGGAPSRRPPKRGSGREVPLPAFALQALYSWPQRLLAAPHPEALVWTTRSGKPLSARNLHRDLAALCRRAGVPRRSPHDLRDSCATLLLEAGSRPPGRGRGPRGLDDPGHR
jgi:integrase